MLTESPPTDELVRRARGGDAEAFGLLYDRTIRLVRAVAADAGPGLAEDVAHDAYLRAYRSLDRLDDPGRFAAWVVGIARRVVRERRRARRVESLMGDVPGPASGADAGGGDAEEVDALLRAVDRLPAEERLAVRFFFLNERGIDETARLLGRSRSGTYAVLKAARGRLARWLAAAGVEP